MRHHAVRGEAGDTPLHRHRARRADGVDGSQPPPTSHIHLEGILYVSRSSSGKSPFLVLAVIGAGLGLVIVMFVLTRKPAGVDAAGVSAKPPGASAGGAVPPASGSGACAPTHCPGAACDACTAVNCTPTTDGCDRIDDLPERRLCEGIYGCLNDPE